MLWVEGKELTRPCIWSSSQCPRLFIECGMELVKTVPADLWFLSSVGTWLLRSSIKNRTMGSSTVGVFLDFMQREKATGLED